MVSSLVHKSLHWMCDLMNRGVVRPEWFITHTWRLADSIEAFETVQRGEAIEAFITAE